MANSSSSTPAPADPWTAEVMRLVEVDQKATVELVARLVTIQTATRSVVVPIAGAFAGLALTNNAPALAFVAIPILLIAIGIESRLGRLQQQAHRRAVYLEGIVQANLTDLANRGTVVSGDATAKLYRKLDGYQFGSSRSLRAVPFKKLMQVAVRRAVTWMYVALIAIAVVAGLAASALAPDPVEACLKVGDGSSVRVTGSGVTLSGDVDVVPCPAR